MKPTRIATWCGLFLTAACSVEAPEGTDAARPPVVGGDGVRLTDTGDTRRIDVDASQTPVVADCAVGEVVIRTAEGWGCLDPVALNRSVFSVEAATAEQCPGGGARVATGLDANRDGVLQAAEADETTLVCAATGNEVATVLSADADFTQQLEQNVIAVVDREFVRLLDTTTLTVGPNSEYATIPEALAFLANYRFRVGAVITLELEPLSFATEPSYVYSSPITVIHPDGTQIHIVAGGTASDRAELRFEGTAGLVIDNPGLGFLDRIVFRGDDTNSDADGIVITRGAYARLGSNVVVEQFAGEGIVATDNATLECEPGVTARDNGIGFLAVNSAFISAPLAEVSNSARGFVASNGSAIRADGARVTNATRAFEALDGSSISGGGAVCAGSTDSCFVAQYNSVVRAQNHQRSGCTKTATPTWNSMVDLLNGTGACSVTSSAGIQSSIRLTDGGARQ